MILTFSILKHDEQILGVKGLVNGPALLRFISDCQFRYGGVSKAPGENPGMYVVEWRVKLLTRTADPYHTYLSLAVVCMYSEGSEAWKVERVDPLLNAREETSRWAREHVRARVYE